MDDIHSIFFLLFTPTANAQQTASLVSLELKNEKLSAALKQIEKMGGKNILFAYEETENYHVTASIRKQTAGEAIQHSTERNTPKDDSVYLK